MTNIPTLTLASEPAEEPVTLSEAKLFLKVDSDDHDEVITRFIKSARKSAENYMRRALITQSWKLSYDDYIPARASLPKAPIQAITHVKIIARDDAETIVPANTYYLAASGTLVLSASLIGHRIEVQYAAGYGDATQIPVEIKQGILSHIAAMFAEPVSAVMPTNSINLYESYRLIRL